MPKKARRGDWILWRSCEPSWVLETQCGFSTRVACSLSHWAISPVLFPSQIQESEIFLFSPKLILQLHPLSILLLSWDKTLTLALPMVDSPKSLVSPYVVTSLQLVNQWTQLSATLNISVREHLWGQWDYPILHPHPRSVPFWKETTFNVSWPGVAMLPSMTSRFILSLQGRKDSAHPLTGHTDNLLLAFQSFHTTDISKKE